MLPLDDAKIADLLVETKLITKEKLAIAQELSKKVEISLYEALLQKSLIDDVKYGKVLADYYKLPFINLIEIEIPEGVLFTIPEEVARKNEAVVFGVDNECVKIATPRPGPGIEMLKANLEKKVRKKIQLYYVTYRDLGNALSTYKKNLQYTFEKLLKQEGLCR